MKKFRILSLCAFFFVGFNYNCSDDVNPWDDFCKCPENIIEFFDIKGVELTQYQSKDFVKIIEEKDIVDFEDYLYMLIDFEVDYISCLDEIGESRNWNFSTMSSAYGCSISCIPNGHGGSKEEMIESFNIVSLYDYNNEFLANDTINELFEVLSFLPEMEDQDLDTFLESDNSFVSSERLHLKPKLKPTLSKEFQIRITIELSTNETYEVTSPLIYFED